MVDRKEYGEIYFSKKDINKGLRYADTSEEKAALAVLPQVLKHGIEIGGHGQHEGRSKQTITFAAPVELNGIRGNMAVVVNRHGNHYYAYKIVLPDGTAFRFAEGKNNAAQELSRGVTVSGSLADTTSAASSLSITQNNQERKAEDVEILGLSLPILEDERLYENNQRKKLTKEQKEFFRESKVRDEDGQLMVMYHGTDAGEDGGLSEADIRAVQAIRHGPELIKLYVEEMNDPNSENTAKRAYQLQNIEISNPKVQGSSKSSIPINRTADMKSIADGPTLSRVGTPRYGDNRSRIKNVSS